MKTKKILIMIGFLVLPSFIAFPLFRKQMHLFKKTGYYPNGSTYTYYRF